MGVILITGPVRSGKSAFAQRCAQRSGLRVRYLATARRDHTDEEWEARLARHAADRPHTWAVVETAELPWGEQAALLDAATSDECILFDSLGTWLAAQMHDLHVTIVNDFEGAAATLEERGLHLVNAFAACRAQCLVIGEQVGWDVVPATPSARIFRDVLGRLQQQFAAKATHAYLVVAGQALDLKALAAEPGLIHSS